MDFLEDNKKPMMRCMICWQSFDCSGRGRARLDTIKKHHKRKHRDLDAFTDERKKLVTRKYTKQMEEAQKEMQKLTHPDWLAKVAPYKLAFVIGQRKKPLSDCDMI